MTSFSARTFSVKVFAFAALSALVIAQAPSALASGALAVGQTGNVTKDGIAMGWATGSPNQKAAEDLAMKHCLNFKDAPDRTRALCQIVNSFENQCVAVALDPKAGTPGYGYAVRKTQDDSKSQAIKNCRATAGNRAQHCVVTVSSCDNTPTAAPLVSEKPAEAPALRPDLPRNDVPAFRPQTAYQPPGSRVALVIGNSSYRNVSNLPNPQRDAAQIADTLRSVGFQNVMLATDLTRDKMISALRDFAALAEQAEWALVYYAGHGIEVGGANYLLPVDARIRTDADVSLEAISLDQVINVAERASKLRLIVLDACRDNPFASQMRRTLATATRSVTRGLAQVEPSAGTLVAYAAKHGETALDGSGTNSPFATALIKNMLTPGLEVRRLFDNVRDDVMDLTRSRQQPFSYGSISGRQDFYFIAKN